EEALAYSRMRKQDPRGDFGRQDRQRQIIKAVIDKGASFSTLTKFDDILDILGENISTNLTFDEMKTIQKHYKDATGSLEQSAINGSGKMINGIYYFIVPEEERLALSGKLKEHLELDQNVTQR